MRFVSPVKFSLGFCIILLTACGGGGPASTGSDLSATKPTPAATPTPAAAAAAAAAGAGVAVAANVNSDPNKANPSCAQLAENCNQAFGDAQDGDSGYASGTADGQQEVCSALRAMASQCDGPSTTLPANDGTFSAANCGCSTQASEDEE